MDLFLSRQPILTQSQEIRAYEILYQPISQTEETDDDSRSLELITNALYTVGLQNLTRGKPALMNFSPLLLEDEVIGLLPVESVIIELSDSYAFTEEIINRCADLKRHGIRFALKATRELENAARLVPVVDYVKADSRTCSLKQQQQILTEAKKHKKLCIAAKVETRKQFTVVRQMGYDLFQGFFFQKPTIVKATVLEVNNLLTLDLWQEIYRQPMDLPAIEELIKKDVALSFRLLQWVNSSAYGLRNEVRSIRQALVFLGEREIKKWLTALLLRVRFDEKPDELLINALVRAKYCEELLERVLNQSASEGFFLGLFSLIDAILDRPMEQILEELPLSLNVKDALQGTEGTLLTLLDSIRSIEQGDWQGMLTGARAMGVAGEVLQQAYLDALYDTSPLTTA